MTNDTITFALSLLAGALFVAWLVLTIVGRRMDRDEKVRQDGRLALVLEDPTGDVAECGMVTEDDERWIMPPSYLNLTAGHYSCFDAWHDGRFDDLCRNCAQAMQARAS